MNNNVFEIEKKLLKAESSKEIESITENLSELELKVIIKLLISRINLSE